MFKKIEGIYNVAKTIAKTLKGNKTSNTIKSVKPGQNLKEFQKHKEDIIKSTDKYGKGLTDEGKIKVKQTVAPALSKLSKITQKLPEKKAKGGRIGLKGGGFPDLSGDGEITQKDILMAKGVIPKTKNKNKKKVI